MGNPGQDLVQELKDFARGVLDRNKDGKVDISDLTFEVNHAAAGLYHYVVNVFERIAPAMPGIATAAVMAAVSATGDKRKVALQDVAQMLADEAVHAAVAEGREEASAIGDKYGVPGALVGTLIDATYLNLKAAGKIR